MNHNKFPFDGNSMKELFGKIKKGTFIMPQAFSKECKDLISKMICFDPKQRLTCAEIMLHPWLVNAKGYEHLNYENPNRKGLHMDLVDKLM
jgi:calcium-dependent protein kinase